MLLCFSGCAGQEEALIYGENADWFEYELLEMGEEYNTESETVTMSVVKYADSDYICSQFWLDSGNMVLALCTTEGDFAGDIRSTFGVGTVFRWDDKFCCVSGNSICELDFKDGFADELVLVPDVFFDAVCAFDDFMYVSYTENTGDCGIKVFDSNFEETADVKTDRPATALAQDGDAGKLYFFWYDEMDGYAEKYGTIDLNTMSVESDGNELAYDLTGYCADGLIYFQSVSGNVSAVNLSTGETDVLFDFNDCDFNYNTLLQCELSYADENIIIMPEQVVSYRGEAESDRQYVVVLRRADTNPYSGREMLMVGSMDGPSEAVAEGALLFNQSNDKTRVVFVTDYNTANFVDSDNARMSSVDKLKVDIAAGDGPDMFLGAAYFSDLSNEKYFANIQDYADALDSDLYFANVWDAYSEDGELYAMPLSFGVTGIVTDSKNAGKSGAGFTYSEYNDFVDKTCSGTDPLAQVSDSYFYFNYCFTPLSDVFVSDDGTLNLDNDNFRELLQFVKDNQYKNGECYEASYNTVSDIYQYISSGMYAKNQTVLGTPSPDGRGPSIEVGDSVSVTLCCRDTTSAETFIDVLLSQESQSKNIRYTPVNKAAYEECAAAAIAKAEADLDIQIPKTITENFAQIPETAAVKKSANSAMQVVFSEELPSYFSGDKSEEQIIPILEDRCNTIVNEG